MKNCPYCAEEIQDQAIKCRYCCEWLGTHDNAWKHSAAPGSHAVPPPALPSVLEQAESPTEAVLAAATSDVASNRVDRPAENDILPPAAVFPQNKLANKSSSLLRRVFLSILIILVVVGGGLVVRRSATTVKDYLDDRKAWLNATSTQTATSYRLYLNARPSGRWSKDASKEIERLYNESARRYVDSRSAGYNPQGSDAVLQLVDYSRRTQRNNVYIVFERKNGASPPVSDMKTDLDEANTVAEIKDRFRTSIPDEILNFSLGIPGDDDATFAISYSVNWGSSAYVEKESSRPYYLHIPGTARPEFQGIAVNWRFEMRIPSKGIVYEYTTQTKPRKEVGWAFENSGGIYQSMLYDCFYEFRRDLVSRLGVYH